MKQIFTGFIAVTMLLLYSAVSVAQQDCLTPLDILSIPYSATGLSTTGMVNDYDDLDACGSASMVNEDFVFRFVPASDMQINIALLNTSIVNAGMLPFANIGLFLTDKCPDDPMANCIASVDDVQSNPSLSDINVLGGNTYYIIVSTANTLLGSTSNVNFDIEITKNMELDAAITSVELPYSACDLVSGYVGCYITNNGYAAISGFDVNYSINGGAVVTETYTGVINAYETAFFQFGTEESFATIGTYNVEVYSALAGDENAANDMMAASIVHYPIYNSFPFSEDFESGDGYWSTGGTASSWEYGNPDELLPELVINSAASGDYIWVTNLDGNTNSSETSYIESPCYDLSSLFLPTLDLNYWAAFSLFGNTANVQASTDGGASWTVTVADLTATEGWENIVVQMPDLAGQSNVKFRINYTGGFLVANGIAIDDFGIKEAVLNDVGVTAILTPNTSCGLSDIETVSIEVTNFGAQDQTNVAVNYSVDGGSTWLAADQTIASIVAGATVQFMFTLTADLSAAGEYEIIAKTNHTGDEDNSNDEFYKLVLSQNTIPADDYTESFEAGAAGWYAYGENSTMELAMPANTLISAAADGDYAWVTNAMGFNDPAEISYLESPCFDFSDMVNPKFKAMVQYETSMLANFYLEYSIDGYTWDTVNAGLAATGWYGGGLLSFGTWSGSSEGWIQVATDMNYLAGQSSVKFRFVFNNGTFSMADTEGVAVDMINIYDCDVFPNAEFSYTVNGFEVSFIDESENADTWAWNFGDNEFLPSTSTEQNPMFTYMMDGQYYVTLTVTNECSSSEYGTYIDITTLNEINNSDVVSIYPNPTSSFINIDNVTANNVEIVDATGKIVFVSTVESNYIRIDVRELPAGNYFIKTGEKVFSFVKE
ncbi:MAG: PKD domain-containing protein [Bacteroidales bacterium]|nr:PKD domain-containing protein [Bacteroidales bacterium]